MTEFEKQIREKLEKNWVVMSKWNTPTDKFLKLSKQNDELLFQLREHLRAIRKTELPWL